MLVYYINLKVNFILKLFAILKNIHIFQKLTQVNLLCISLTSLFYYNFNEISILNFNYFHLFIYNLLTFICNSDYNYSYDYLNDNLLNNS